jgi:ABC-type sugar transport system ATPase subunit
MRTISRKGSRVDDSAVPVSGGVAGSVEYADAEPLVRAVGLNKFFGGIRALAGVDLTVRRGEVLALVGENGAGKSTVVRIISGLEKHDAGELWIGDRLVTSPSPMLARHLGVMSVPQQLALCDNLGADLNVVLPVPPLTRFRIGSFGIIDRAEAARRAKVHLDRIGAKLPSLTLPIVRMSGGQRQAIAIARAMEHGAKVLIFDEPTAALGLRQRDETLRLCRAVAEGGVGVIVVTHSVEDVFEVADRVCAFRQGRVVMDKPITDCEKKEIRDVMEGV